MQSTFFVTICYKWKYFSICFLLSLLSSSIKSDKSPSLPISLTSQDTKEQTNKEQLSDPGPHAFYLSRSIHGEGITINSDRNSTSCPAFRTSLVDFPEIFYTTFFFCKSRDKTNNNSKNHVLTELVAQKSNNSFTIKEPTSTHWMMAFIKQ